MRMRWRDRATNTVPQAVVPGKVYKVDVSLWNTSYVFPAGHRMRVSVSSSNYPRFSTNPNLGLPLIHEAGKQPLVSINTVHHSQQYPSSLTLPVVPLSALPEVDILVKTHQHMDKLPADVRVALLSAAAEFEGQQEEAHS